jgi:hypothetical protein
MISTVGTLALLGVHAGDRVQTAMTPGGNTIPNGAEWVIKRVTDGVFYGARDTYPDNHPGTPLCASTVFRIISRASVLCPTCNRARKNGRCSVCDAQARLDQTSAKPKPQAPEPENVKADIAAEAVRIVDGTRRGAYGHPEDNFGRIARFWTAYFQNTGRDMAISAQDVSPMMRLLKEARLCDNPTHYDSLVDLVGYTLTGAEVNGVKKPA